MSAEERAARRRERRARQAERRRKDVPGLLFGLLIPVLVAALVFGRGEPLPGMMTLALGALAAYLLWNPQTGANLRRVLGNREAQGVASMVVPAMFLSGIFGGPVMMLAVLVLAATALVLAARYGHPQAGPVTPPHFQQQTVPSLPAAASGEALPALDIRELCRGLPAPLAGEVLATVEHLEAAEALAAQGGDARRRYDATQSLKDYLPNTVNAWKGQAPDQRDPQELARALEQIKRIAGADEHSSGSARHSWETQKRFLDSRSEKTSLELK